jgi:hypothetical protein
MGSGYDDWVYWHFFTITFDYNSSHIELLLNDVSLANLYEESQTALSLISDCSLTNLGLISTTAFYNCHATGISHHV